MRKMFILIFCLSAFKVSASTIFLNSCFNFGTKVSFSFINCVNSNFSTIDRSLGTFSSYCSNIGNELNYGFVSCVNRNFLNITSKLPVFTSSCFNFGDQVSPSFVNCVNRNFREVQRVFNSQN